MRSMRSKGGFAVILVLAGALCGGPALAQEEEPTIRRGASDDSYTVAFPKEGVDFIEFVNTAAQMMNISFTFDERRVQNKKLNMIGPKTVRREDLFAFFQTLFFAHDLAVIPLGPPEAEVLLIEDIKTSQILKQRAVFVDIQELERRRRNAGEIVATTIQLTYIPVEKAQRALTQIIQEHRAGFVQPIEESNSLLITNFAPTVWTMYEIIRAMDVEVAENQLIFEKLPLEYHLAEQLAPIIEELLEARANVQGAGQPGAARRPRGGTPGISEPPQPRVIADGRQNSLLVYAVPEDLTEIKLLVANLDTEITEANSNIHIYELKNTNAEDIEQTLTDLFADTGGRSARPSGVGGARNAPGGAPGAVGASGVDEDAVNIVADANTNSLLITATRTRFEEIAEIIQRLDRRRPQVFLQVAIAELSDTDIENIGVELGLIEGGGPETRIFGGTGFGLSTIDTVGNVTGGDGGGDGMGGGDGGGSADGSENFFDDLVRIPNLGTPGLTTGLFRNFIEVPLLLQLFEQTVRSNLVSVPSILVNDNQEAHIIVGNEIPTTTVTQGQVSDQTSFGGYQEANLELIISPHISNDDYLRLNVLLNVQAFDGVQINSSVPPPRTTREIETQITVPSGRTVVIGGLTNDNFRETVSGVPFLSDIPLIGELFKSTSESHEKRTLYVFITPTILSDFESLDRISYERKLEIAKLEGQIKLIDPSFRELDIEDEEISVESLESTGNLDLPRYRPSTPQAALAPKSADKLPMTPDPLHLDEREAPGFGETPALRDDATLPTPGGRTPETQPEPADER